MTSDKLRIFCNEKNVQTHLLSICLAPPSGKFSAIIPERFGPIELYKTVKT